MIRAVLYVYLKMKPIDKLRSQCAVARHGSQRRELSFSAGSRRMHEKVNIHTVFNFSPALDLACHLYLRCQRSLLGGDATVYECECNDERFGRKSHALHRCPHYKFEYSMRDE